MTSKEEITKIKHSLDNLTKDFNENREIAIREAFRLFKELSVHSLMTEDERLKQAIDFYVYYMYEYKPLD